MNGKSLNGVVRLINEGCHVEFVTMPNGKGGAFLVDSMLEQSCELGMFEFDALLDMKFIEQKSYRYVGMTRIGFWEKVKK